MSDSNNETGLDEHFTSIEDEVSSDKIPVRVSSETHFGVEGKSGGYLENTISQIVEFAGFKTKREQSIFYSDNSNDSYRIDVLGKLNDLTLFIECKDLDKIKIDSKILFTLIGQINDYRLTHPTENVVGILATSAKNADGINNGVSERLESESCYLWDGLKIQQLKNHIYQSHDSVLFQKTILHEINYMSQEDQEQKEAIQLKPNEHKFFTRISFYSISSHLYIGDEFGVDSIMDDLKSQINSSQIKLFKTKYKFFKDTSSDERIYFKIDFELKKTISDIDSHAMKMRGPWYRRNNTLPLSQMEYDFIRACKLALEKTYGIEKEFSNEYPFKVITKRIV